MEEAIQDILEEFGLADLPRVPYDYDELLVRTDEVQQARIAKARADLKAPLSDQIQSASVRVADSLSEQIQSASTRSTAVHSTNNAQVEESTYNR